MNITLSTPMLKLIDDLLRTGLWGATHEDVARALIEVQLRYLQASGELGRGKG